jgi:predicted ATP-grasp superfamily ATP-dependent carboligase
MVLLLKHLLNSQKQMKIAVYLPTITITVWAIMKSNDHHPGMLEYSERPM